MVFKIIHQFVGDEGVLREIKWLNIPKNSPKDELYEWQWLPFGYDTIKLKFQSSTNTSRRFEEGSLVFDHVGGTFVYYNKSYRLNRSK